MSFRVDFLRHGYNDHITFDTRADAEAFIDWGQCNGSAFVRAAVTEGEAGDALGRHRVLTPDESWITLLGEWASLEAGPKSSALMLAHYAPETCEAIADLLRGENSE